MNLENQQNSAPQQRSIFVNVLAWIFIIYSGFVSLAAVLALALCIPSVFAVFMGVLQNKQFENVHQIQEISNKNVSILAGLFLLCLIVSVTTFVSALAFLKRKNWARIVFIILLSLGIVWNVTRILYFTTLYFTAFNTMPEIDGGGYIVFHASMAALFGWAIKKLISLQLKGTRD